jgi:hypothetical protein
VEGTEESEIEMRAEKRRQLERELDDERAKKEGGERRKQALVEVEREKLRAKREASQESQKVAAASALIIENDAGNPDPVSSTRN